MWFVRRRFRRGGSGTIQGVMQTIPEQLPDTEVTGSRAATQMRREEQAWNWVLDWILPLLTVLVLLASCVLGSAKKEIWIDEAYTLQVITDPSLPHMMHALANAVDGGMPLYYIWRTHGESRSAPAFRPCACCPRSLSARVSCCCGAPCAEPIQHGPCHLPSWLRP